MRRARVLYWSGLLAWTAALVSSGRCVTTPPDNAEVGSSAGRGDEINPAGDNTAPTSNVPAPPSTPPRAQDWSHPRVGGTVTPTGQLQQSWVDFTAIQPGLFPGVRHHVRRWTSPTVSWVSPNSPSSIIPEPPLQGPSACGCPAPATEGANAPTDVYGQMERDRLWTWCAVFFDTTDDSFPEQTHFIPDIWAGRGPCRALNRRGILHRFPSDGVGQDAAGRYHILEEARRVMDNQNGIDEGLIPRIWHEETAREEAQIPAVDRRVFGGANSPEELRELWAAWVQTILARRGYILHELLVFASYRWLEASDPVAWQRLIEDEHFGPAPLGVWFQDTLKYAPQIRYYLMLGVPVYYRWDVSFFSEPRLADLRPRDAPVDALQGLPNPPMSPHRSATRRAQALWMHDNSRRALPAPAGPEPERASAAEEPLSDPFDDVAPEVMDDRDFELLSDRMTEIESEWHRKRIAKGGNRTEPSKRPALKDRISGLPFPLLPRSATPGPALLGRISSSSSQPSSLLSRFDAGSGPAGSSTSPPPSLLSRFDAGSGPAGSSRGPTAESRARMVSSAAATPDGVHQEGFRDSWRFAVTTDTPASRSFLDMLRSGLLPTHQERIGFSFETGMPFATPVRRQPTAFDIAQSWQLHAVRNDWFILPTMTPAQQYARWRESATRVLARLHARAALLRGGLLARIAIHLGLDLNHALQGPSDDARLNGTPFPMEDADGTELWDDYLSADEIAILVGQVGVGGTVTLFPRPETFTTFWWGDGAWTEEHEQWFTARLRELEGATQPAGRTRDGWRSALKKNQRYPQS